MVKKYIIDKCDIYDLLTGKELETHGGNAFCIEITQPITNGDIIRALFPEMEFKTNKAGIVHNYFNEITVKGGFWDLPYKGAKNG